MAVGGHFPVAEPPDVFAVPHLMSRCLVTTKPLSMVQQPASGR